MKPIYIDGEAGTTGLQIREKLAAVPAIEILSLPTELRKDVQKKREIMATVALVILCLPDDAAREAVELIDAMPDKRPKILDASTAHRVAEGWVFGLPELGPEQEAAIIAAAKVSNPGCYPTGSILLLRPLAAAGIIPPDYPICVHAVSGYSGGGRKMIEAFENGTAPLFELYGLRLRHKHIPELQRYAGLTRRPIFVPSVASFRQGMIDFIPLHLDLLAKDVRRQDIHACLTDYYRDSQYVKVIDPGAVDGLTPDALNGSNLVELRVHGDAVPSQVVLTAQFDNLGKGASGAAVQNLGLMLEVDVRAALAGPTAAAC